jgi:hypothetical protein
MTFKFRCAFACSLLALTTFCRAETHTFHWINGPFAGQANRNLAMLVSVEVGGRTCDMQIDTGANASVIWHEYSGSNSTGEPLTVKLGTLSANAEAGVAVRKMVEQCESGHPIGTLGNAFFERGTLTIDSARQRLEYQTGSGLGTSTAAQPFFYASWASTGGHILIEVQMDGAEKGYALLDTGAAASDIGVLDDLRWKQLVGAEPATGSNVARFTVPSWGRSLECFLARAANDITVGGVRIGTPDVTYCPSLPFQAPVRIIGIVGMHPFRHGVLVIDYPGRRWLVEGN